MTSAGPHTDLSFLLTSQVMFCHYLEAVLQSYQWLMLLWLSFFWVGPPALLIKLWSIFLLLTCSPVALRRPLDHHSSLPQNPSMLQFFKGGHMIFVPVKFSCNLSSKPGLISGQKRLFQRLFHNTVVNKLSLSKPQQIPEVKSSHHVFRSYSSFSSYPELSFGHNACLPCSRDVVYQDELKSRTYSSLYLV